MYFTKLRLRNFRSHADTELNLERINVIRGVNGAGKSSIQMALELLLTGRCAITDAAGRGGQDLIRTGSSETIVEADLSPSNKSPMLPMSVRRTQGGSTLAIGNLAVGRNAYEWIAKNIAPLGVLSSVLNAHRFLEMKPNEQAALLAAALESDSVQVDKEIAEKISRVLGHGAMALPIEIRNAAELEQSYKAFFNRRTETNRELATLGDIQPPDRPEGLPAVADTQAKIQGLENEKRKAIEKRAKLLATSGSAQIRHQAAAETKRIYEQKIAEGPELEKLRKTFGNKAKAIELDAKISNLQEQRRLLEQNITRAKNEPSQCPTCGQEIVRRLVGELAKWESEYSEFGKDLEKAQAARTKLGDWTTAEARLSEHKDAITKCNEADTILKDPEPAPVNTAEIDGEISQLEERIAKGHQVEKQAIEYEAAARQYKQIADKQGQLNDRLAVLEELCEYFGPRSPLRAKLMGSRLDDFRARMNQVLSRFGFACKFELQPYEITVQKQSDPGPALQLHQLSESEQFRFGIAFQIALAEATGVRFVVVDRADMLTPGARLALSAELMQSNLDQAFILATSEPVDEQVTIPGVAFISLTNINGTSSQEAYAAAGSN